MFSCSKLTIERLRTYLTPCSSVYFVNFEHEIAQWQKMFNKVKNFQPNFLVEKFSVKKSLSADFRTTLEAPVNEKFPYQETM